MHCIFLPMTRLFFFPGISTVRFDWSTPGSDWKDFRWVGGLEDDAASNLFTLLHFSQKQYCVHLQGLRWQAISCVATLSFKDCLTFSNHLRMILQFQWKSTCLFQGDSCHHSFGWPQNSGIWGFQLWWSPWGPENSSTPVQLRGLQSTPLWKRRARMLSFLTTRVVRPSKSARRRTFHWCWTIPCLELWPLATILSHRTFRICWFFLPVFQRAASKATFDTDSGW